MHLPSWWSETRILVIHVKLQKLMFEKWNEGVLSQLKNITKSEYTENDQGWLELLFVTLIMHA